MEPGNMEKHIFTLQAEGVPQCDHKIKQKNHMVMSITYGKAFSWASRKNSQIKGAERFIINTCK
jgi:hypothetical protein